MSIPVYHWFESLSGCYSQACNVFWSIGLDCPYHMECFDSGMNTGGKMPFGYFGVSSMPAFTQEAA